MKSILSTFASRHFVPLQNFMSYHIEWKKKNILQKFQLNPSSPYESPALQLEDKLWPAALNGIKTLSIYK